MEREEAIKWQEAFKKTYGNFPPEATEACDMSIEALKEPERKKGHWEDFDWGNSYRCTSCGEIWTLNDGTPEENNMNYCPKCGADMGGEQE